MRSNKEVTSFSELNVSSSWKRKFEILERAGELSFGRYENMNQLNMLERMKIGFNFPAMLLGPLYYFMKGMWTRGGILLTGILLLDTGLMCAELFGGIIAPDVLYWAPGAALCASLANYDYYRSVVYQESIWSPLRAFGHTAVVSAMVCFSMLMYGAFIWMFFNTAGNSLTG